MLKRLRKRDAPQTAPIVQPTDDNFLIQKFDGGSTVRVFLRGQFKYEINVQVDEGDDVGPRTRGLLDIMWALSPRQTDGKYRLYLWDTVPNIINDVRRPRMVVKRPNE